MKKIISIVCLLAMFLAIPGIAGVGLCDDHTANVDAIYVKQAQTSTELQFTMGSKDYLVDKTVNKMDVVPFTREARTLVPIRYVIEAFGGSIAWFQETQEASITINATNIIMKAGESTASVNGIVKEIDQANPKVVPVNAYGRIFVPLRFVMESINAEIIWNPYKRIVTIRYPKPGSAIFENVEFSIDYPSNWTKESTTQTVSFTSPEGNIISVLSENLETSMTVAQYYDKNIAALKDTLEDEKILGGSTLNLSSGEGRKITFTASVDNVQLKFTQVFTVKNKTGFIITYAGDPGMYFNYEDIFNRALTTFAIN
jgi:hypothetical protein